MKKNYKMNQISLFINLERTKMTLVWYFKQKNVAFKHFHLPDILLTV